MKIQWNKVTWYSKIAAVVLGVVIFALGIYIGIAYQKGVDALEWSKQVRINRPVIDRGTDKSAQAYEFSEIGNIRNLPPPGSNEDWWGLLYERPGAPALSKRLLFTTDSLCIIDMRAGLCDTAKLIQGQRAAVMGHANEKGEIVVERLEAI